MMGTGTAASILPLFPPQSELFFCIKHSLSVVHVLDILLTE